jgi:hypothetical protein
LQHRRVERAAALAEAAEAAALDAKPLLHLGQFGHLPQVFIESISALNR